jgi:hypothetical protein
MEETVTITPNNDKVKFISKDNDRMCEVIIKYRGVFEGHIERISSSGNYLVKLIKKIEDR